MSELKTGYITQIWHSSKIKIQSGQAKRFLHMLKDASAEVSRFSGHGSCVLRVGDSLTFRESEDGDVYDVKFDIETPEFPEFEDSQIVEFHPRTNPHGCGYGFAERQCSRRCRIYIRDDEEHLLTEGRMGQGVRIRHATEEQHDARTKAARISIYKN